MAFRAAALCGSKGQDSSQCLSGAAGHVSRKGENIGEERAFRVNALHEPETERLAGVDRRPGEEEPEPRRHSHRIEETIAATPSGGETEGEVAHAQRGTLAGDSEMAGEGELEPAADRGPVQGRDPNPIGAGDPIQDPGHRGGRRRERVGRSFRREVVKVAAGAEGSSGPRQDDDAHVGSGRCEVHRLRQRIDQRAVHRVRAVGPVQLDEQYAAGAVFFDEYLAHPVRVRDAWGTVKRPTGFSGARGRPRLRKV